MPVESGVAFFFDTDALTQIFIAGQQSILQTLRDEFGVACFIMMEVETELRSKPKLAGLIKPQLDKALKSGWLKVLSSSDLEQHPALNRTIPVSLANIRQLGVEYENDIQIGEAYTYAAAILLDVPAVSNDRNAIRVLESQGKSLPPTVLRSFDLFGFLYLESYIDSTTAEQIRTTLRGYNEWIPASMKNASFRDGLGAMKCRLSTSLATSAGRGWDQPFFLQRPDKH